MDVHRFLHSIPRTYQVVGNNGTFCWINCARYGPCFVFCLEEARKDTLGWIRRVYDLTRVCYALPTRGGFIFCIASREIHCTALLCNKLRKQWPCAEPLTIALRSRRNSSSLTQNLNLHVSCIWVIRTPKIILLSKWKLKHNSSYLKFAKIFLKNGWKEKNISMKVYILNITWRPYKLWLQYECLCS
jgi:hypothetical protein